MNNNIHNNNKKNHNIHNNNKKNHNIQNNNNNCDYDNDNDTEYSESLQSVQKQVLLEISSRSSPQINPLIDSLDNTINSSQTYSYKRRTTVHRPSDQQHCFRPELTSTLQFKDVTPIIESSSPPSKSMEPVYLDDNVIIEGTTEYNNNNNNNNNDDDNNNNNMSILHLDSTISPSPNPSTPSSSSLLTSSKDEHLGKLLGLTVTSHINSLFDLDHDNDDDDNDTNIQGLPTSRPIGFSSKRINIFDLDESELNQPFSLSNDMQNKKNNVIDDTEHQEIVNVAAHVNAMNNDVSTPIASKEKAKQSSFQIPITDDHFADDDYDDDDDDSAY
jgi:hypothetical protein